MKDQQLVKNYATNMVKLYAEFDRSKLLPFLRGSVQYNLDMALNEVKVRGFKPELVFLLGRCIVHKVIRLWNHLHSHLFKTTSE